MDYFYMMITCYSDQSDCGKKNNNHRSFVQVDLSYIRIDPVRHTRGTLVCFSIVSAFELSIEYKISGLSPRSKYVNRKLHQVSVQQRAAYVFQVRVHKRLLLAESVS